MTSCGVTTGFYGSGLGLFPVAAALGPNEMVGLLPALQSERHSSLVGSALDDVGRFNSWPLPVLQQSLQYLPSWPTSIANLQAPGNCQIWLETSHRNRNPKLCLRKSSKAALSLGIQGFQTTPGMTRVDISYSLMISPHFNGASRDPFRSFTLCSFWKMRISNEQLGAVYLL